MPPSPEERGVALPRSIPLHSLGGQQSACHWRRPGYGGRGPHIAPVCVWVPPPGVVRVSSLCAGAGSLACRCPRGSRRWGAWGRAACGLSCVPSRAPRPLRGGACLGGVEGWRPGGPQAAGGSGGEGEGGSRRGSRTPALGGGQWPTAQSPFLSAAPPPGYMCLARVARQPRARGAAWPAVGGSAWRGGGGGGVLPGRGAGRSLCRSSFPCLPRAGTKVGHFVRASPSMLHSASQAGRATCH